MSEKYEGGVNARTVVLNAAKMNFDGKLDFSVLSDEVQEFDDTAESQLLERIQGADIVVTKEMPVSGDLIRQFPDSLIAGMLHFSKRTYLETEDAAKGMPSMRR